jgi:hypothetical protein
MNAIYSPRLEYTSSSENPEKELLYAIETVCDEEIIAKCFGYLFNMFNKYRIVFIVNAYIFELDVIIKDNKVTIIKGSFNEIKMYLVAKIAKKMNVSMPENGLQYIKKRVNSMLNSTPVDYLNVKFEIETMENTIKFSQRNGYFTKHMDSIITFRNNLKRYINDINMIHAMESPHGFGIRLTHYISKISYTTFSHHISKLYLISSILDYTKLNEQSKALCRIMLLEYHTIEDDNYPEILYGIAEWMYGKYFKDIFMNDIVIEMDKVD